MQDHTDAEARVRHNQNQATGSAETGEHRPLSALPPRCVLSRGSRRRRRSGCLPDPQARRSLDRPGSPTARERRRGRPGARSRWPAQWRHRRRGRDVLVDVPGEEIWRRSQRDARSLTRRWHQDREFVLGIREPNRPVRKNARPERHCPVDVIGAEHDRSQSKHDASLTRRADDSGQPRRVAPCSVAAAMASSRTRATSESVSVWSADCKRSRKARLRCPDSMPEPR